MSQIVDSSESSVVLFRSDGARTRRPLANEEARGAILFFTGVRYERQEVAAPKVKRRGKSRPEDV